MIRLTANQTLQVFLGGAITTNQLSCVAAYTDVNTSQATWITGASSVTNTNSTTVVTLVSAPTSPVIRDVHHVTIRNRDTAQATATVRFNNNGTTYELAKFVLAVDDVMAYEHGFGWYVEDSLGQRKTTTNLANTTILNGTSHTDTAAATVTRGALIVGNSTPKWDKLAVGSANRVLGSDGTDAAWVQADHGAALTGLADDDHTQYALLAGRSSGQTLIGGTGSGENLTLNSTSDSTKGLVKLVAGGGNVTVGGATAASELRFLEPSGSGTNYTAFKAQAQTGDVTYTLPAADGTSGYVLTTNGSGSLSWAAASSSGLINNWNDIQIALAADTDHDITVQPIQIADSTRAEQITLGSAITKQIDASWAAGSAAGGMFTGSVANTTTYHFFLIKKDSDGSVDAGWDTSLSCANIPSGYTYYRRVWSCVTDGSANLRPFLYFAGWTIYSAPILDANGTSVAQYSSSTTITTTIPTGVPLLVKAWAIFVNGSGQQAAIFCPDLSTPNPANVQDRTSQGNGQNGNYHEWSNTSGQLKVVTDTAGTTVYLGTKGYFDPVIF